MIGLVGPNGAGKTTLMRIIATLIQPSRGTVRWNGLDTCTHGTELRRVLGYLPQEFGIYPEFTGRRFLRYLAALKELPKTLGHRRVDEVLELVNLTQSADQKLGTYSGGMKQRLGIAQALLNDPEERVRFRMLLASLTTSRIILLSTHIVGDVEAVASRMLLLRDGQVVADTTGDALLAQASGKVWGVTVNPTTAQRRQATNHVSAMVHRPDGVYLRILSSTCPAESAELVEPTLEDAYLLAMRANIRL